MKMFYERANKVQRSQLIADVPLAKFEARMKASRRFRVFPSGNRVHQIEDPETGQKWVINLEERVCECQNFYEYQSPCSHAIAAARHEEIDPIGLFIPAYTTRYYRHTYSQSLPPVSIQDLTIDDKVLPPIIQKQAGRLYIKRIRKGAWNQKQTRCMNCLEQSYNRRSYRGQPVSSGRRQRAYDWLQAIEEVREEEEGDEYESSEEEDQEVVEEEEEDQGAIIDSDNSSELSEVLSFEVDGINIDSISNSECSKGGDSEGSDGEGSDQVLRTRSGRAFGI